MMADLEASATTKPLKRARPSKKSKSKRPSLRDVSRICVPGIVIDRAVQAALYPIVLAGPELEKRLQPHVARLCGVSSPSRSQRWLRAVLLWLLEDRDTAPEGTECAGPEASFSPAFDPALRDLLPETQRPLWDCFGMVLTDAADPQTVQSQLAALPDRSAEEAQGVH
ncbi:hypothetical protein [Cypionkella sinensis]|uniref:Uncharacterized protein n=1 Tax=Cypionkella sinensis TaxID=1756043 RepID=A0ABV7IY14_9RHOB